MYDNTEYAQDFLSQVPIEIMKENIKTQFSNPTERRKKDHIETFIRLYKASVENADPYDDEENDYYTMARDDFYAFIKDQFQHHLSVGFDNFDDMLKDQQDDVIQYTYKFFIINIRDNFTGYIINKINENRDLYVRDEKRKDVTTLSFKKEVTDPIDLEILSNLYSIIIDILSNLDDIDDFFKHCDIDESVFETRTTRSNYDRFILLGNFTEKYKAMLNDEFISEIESDVRNRILLKYAKDRNIRREDEIDLETSIIDE